MVRRSINPWETQDISSLIPILNDNPRSLFISTSGPARSKQSTPVLLFFTGGGTPVAVYVRLQRLLSQFARVYFYDRAGYDASDPAPQEHPNATDIVTDLVGVLNNIQVGPPYILCGYSWGAIMARTFLDLYPDNVHGLVLADPATELMYELIQPIIPPPCLEVISEGVDWVGLTNLREESKLTDQEWDRMMNALEKSEAASTKEDPRGSGRSLARKHQNMTMPMGDKVLSVLQGDWAAQWQLLYDEGVKRGNGSEEERKEARKFIELLRDYHKGLCYGQVVGISESVYSAYAPGAYHDLVLRNPELVTQAVQVVMRCSETSTANAGRTVTLPRYKATRGTAVSGGKIDGKKSGLADVLLRF